MFKVVLGFVKAPPPKKKKKYIYIYKAGVDIALTIVEIPSEMKVAPRYTLLTLFILHVFHCSNTACQAL